MSTPFEAVRAEELLAHASWIRQLARKLVRDAESAEELSQETWLRALQSPPRGGQPIRGWLATVMRNVLRQERRGSARRREREEVAAAAESLASSAELVERVSTQRDLVQGVLELEEPYRTVVLMRYFEELPPRRIAERTGRSVSTVKTQLARGLEKLRARLARHYGDERSWMMALAPVAAGPAWPGLATSTGGSGGTAPILGTLALNTKIVITVAGIGLGTVLAVNTLRTDRAAERGELPGPAPAAESAIAPLDVDVTLPGGETSRVRRTATREPVAATAAPTEEPPVAAAAATISGRVIDLDDRPVGGVALAWASGRTRDLEGRRLIPGDRGQPIRAGDERKTVGTSGSDGRFEIPAGGGGLQLVVAEERWVTVLAGSGNVDGDNVLVVAPRISLAGSVVEHDGDAVAEALVEVQLPEGFRSRLGRVLDNSETRRCSVRTDELGRFEIPSAPAVPGTWLVASAEGLVPAREALPPRSDSSLVLVMGTPESSDSRVEGIVVDGAGVPLPDARVSLGMDSVVTGEDGAFRFDLDDEESYNRTARQVFSFEPIDALRAVKAGMLATEYVPPRGDDGSLLWPPHVVLRLAGEPFAIEGRVVDGDGSPLADVPVWIDDPTFFGGIPREGSDFPTITHVESEILGTAPGWNLVRTDGDGRFRIEGLLERSYDVVAMDERTLLRTIEERVPAGATHVELALDQAGLFGTLRGRVVDRRGAPVPEVGVRPWNDRFRKRIQGRVIGTRHGAAEGTTTDPDGRFELHDVPRDLVYLRLDGADTVPLEWGRHLEGGLASLIDDPQRFEIVVGRRCHFQVELTDSGEADQLGVFDEQGRPLELSEFRGSTRDESLLMPLVGGRSATLAVSDSAASLALYRDGVELRRMAISLVPGSRTLLHP